MKIHDTIFNDVTCNHYKLTFWIIDSLNWDFLFYIRLIKLMIVEYK